MDYIVTNGKLWYFYNQNTVFLEKLVVMKWQNLQELGQPVGQNYNKLSIRFIRTFHDKPFFSLL